MAAEAGKRHKEFDSRLVRRAFGKLGAGVDGDEDVVGGRASGVSMAGEGEEEEKWSPPSCCRLDLLRVPTTTDMRCVIRGRPGVRGAHTPQRSHSSSTTHSNPSFIMGSHTRPLALQRPVWFRCHPVQPSQTIPFSFTKRRAFDSLDRL